MPETNTRRGVQPIPYSPDRHRPNTAQSSRRGSVAPSNSIHAGTASWLSTPTSTPTKTRGALDCSRTPRMHGEEEESRMNCIYGREAGARRGWPGGGHEASAPTTTLGEDERG
eukprot:2567573-Rhodomonas_salina.3